MGQKTVLMKGWGSYSITSQELFYLFNLALKYVCTIPLALIFLMTTHPSQFASSLNQIGVSYKIAYSVSLTLRYIPDVQEEYQTIKLSQEARGVELSKKAKLIKRIKGNLQIISPLIFSSLERIDSISTAMELRRFGKNKKADLVFSSSYGNERLWDDSISLGCSGFEYCPDLSQSGTFLQSMEVMTCQKRF